MVSDTVVTLGTTEQKPGMTDGKRPELKPATRVLVGKALDVGRHSSMMARRVRLSAPDCPVLRQQRAVRAGLRPAIVAAIFLFLQGFGLGGLIATFGLVLDLIGFLLFLVFVLVSSVMGLRHDQRTSSEVR